MKDERETKEKLLQSARAEFLAKGYQGASLRSICKASGVTTGALYFFFKDKDDLFTSLVAPQLNTLKAMLTEHMRQELLVLDSGEHAAENDFRDDAYASRTTTCFCCCSPAATAPAWNTLWTSWWPSRRSTTASWPTGRPRCWA